MLEPGQSLLIAVSTPGEVTGKSPLLQRIVVLTCLAEAPPADAFRPTFANAEKRIFTYSQVKTELLQKLKVVGTPPSWDSVNAGSSVSSRISLPIGIAGISRRHNIPLLYGGIFAKTLEPPTSWSTRTSHSKTRRRRSLA